MGTEDVAPERDGARSGPPTLGTRHDKIVCLLADDEAVGPETIERVASTLSEATRSSVVVRGRVLEAVSPVARWAERGAATVVSPTPRAMVSVWADADRSVAVRAVRSAIDASKCFTVAETVQLELRPVDEMAGHVVRVGFMQRREGLTRAEFAERWILGHGPLVRGRGPLFERYVNNVVDDELDVGFDGFVEQWFATTSLWAEHDHLVARRKADVAADADSFTGRFEQFRGIDVAHAASRG